MSDIIDLDSAQGPVPQYMRDITPGLSNSTFMQRTAIQHVEDILAGKVTITDATNPFVTLMGVSAANTSAWMLRWINGQRRPYPELANTAEEVYPHMSDADYIGRFALPKVQKVHCVIPLTELTSRMVLQPDGSRRATIPRYSTVTVSGTTFTLMYPVIIQSRIGGGRLSVHYDLSNLNELHPITSSVIIAKERRGRTEESASLVVELEMVQVITASQTYDINPSVGVKGVIDLVDSYSYARVWFKGRNSNTWTELRTTHDDMTYDSGTPTAVLSVIGTQLKIRIPQIYFTTGQVTGKLRVDVYTTKGAIQLNTEGMRVESFQSEYRGDPYDVVTPDVAAFQSIPNKFFYFSALSVGGRAALTDRELRERVIYNAKGPMKQVITPQQLPKAIEDKGFTLRTFVDNTTGRQLLASRALPGSDDLDLITPGSATIEDVLTTIGELKTSPWVANNGDRVTIAPSALWRTVNGVVRLCAADELTQLMAMDAESRVLAINNGNYLFTPFYYVLDTTEGSFGLRAYHLEDNTAIVDRFLGENDTTGMQIEIAGLQLDNTGNGWRLLVSTRSDEGWKQQDAVYRMAQLSYFPPGVGAAAAINGEYLGVDEAGEDVFSFSLPSGYDIDRDDAVSMLGFHAITADVRETFSKLEQEFRLTFISGASMPGSTQPHAMDSALVTAALPTRVRAVGAQQVVLNFGVRLKNLWTACRPLAPATPWRTYDSDMPEVWAADKLEPNPDNGTDVWYHPDGTPYFKYLARAGDPMIENGQQVYRWRKGQTIYQGGLPVPVGQDGIQRQFSVLFLEGGYYFATDASTVEYTDKMTKVMVDYITNGLGGFTERALEKTNLFYYPKITLGQVDALVDGGQLAQIRAEQSLVVRLGVHKRVFENTKLRKELERKTIQVIYDFFDRDVISISDLTDLLHVAYGQDVISVVVTGLGGTDSNAITLLNANERLSLKKRVFILETGEFTVREDVSVDFFNHAAA